MLLNTYQYLVIEVISVHAYYFEELLPQGLLIFSELTLNIHIKMVRQQMSVVLKKLLSLLDTLQVLENIGLFAQGAECFNEVVVHYAIKV